MQLVYLKEMITMIMMMMMMFDVYTKSSCAPGVVYNYIHTIRI